MAGQLDLLVANGPFGSLHDPGRGEHVDSEAAPTVASRPRPLPAGAPCSAAAREAAGLELPALDGAVDEKPLDQRRRAISSRRLGCPQRSMLGRPGERCRDPGPSSSSSTGSTRCRTRERAKRGSSLCGSVHHSMPWARQAASVCCAGDVEQRTPEDVEAAPHPGQRPAATAPGRGRAALSRPGRRECGRAGPVRDRPARRPPPARRSAPRGPPPPGPGRTMVTWTRTDDGLVGTEAGHLGDDVLGLGGRPSCRSWSTVTPTTWTSCL